MWCPWLANETWERERGSEKGGKGGGGRLISSRVMMTRGFMIAKSSNPIYIHEEKSLRRRKGLYIFCNFLCLTLHWIGSFGN